MATLRHIHQLMNERRMVQLSDGRVGKVVRVDTTFPDNATTVTVWTATTADGAPVSTSPLSSGPLSGPGISKVALSDVIGEVTSPAQKSA
jgi:hypothetical protein